MNTRLPPRILRNRQELVARACYVTLRLCGWLAVCVAFVAACWALFFAALGEFTFAGLVLHLDNFADRYISADPLRQAAFRAQFWLASGAVFLVVAVLRLPVLIQSIAPSKERPDGQEHAAGR